MNRQLDSYSEAEIESDSEKVMSTKSDNWQDT